MIIESSNQVPRATLLKRFPVPKNFGVAPESRIGKGSVKNLGRYTASWIAGWPNRPSSTAALT